MTKSQEIQIKHIYDVRENVLLSEAEISSEARRENPTWHINPDSVHFYKSFTGILNLYCAAQFCYKFTSNIAKVLN